MKANPIYAVLAAAVLMAGSVNVVLADDNGKGPGGPSGGNGGNGGNNAAQVRLRTKLAGGAIAGKRPEGNADFRSEQGRTRLSVEVENVNLPDGTVLTVSVQHGTVITVVGTITLNSASPENELELDSQHGDTVPAIVAGDMATVANGAAVILAGAFQ
jgi:hypothetical protein